MRRTLIGSSWLVALSACASSEPSPAPAPPAPAASPAPAAQVPTITATAKPRTRPVPSRAKPAADEARIREAMARAEQDQASPPAERGPTPSAAPEGRDRPPMRVPPEQRPLFATVGVDGGPGLGGAGFVVDAAGGLVLTSAALLRGLTFTTVRTHEGHYLPARLLATGGDVALLHVADLLPGTPELKLAAAAPAAGAAVRVVLVGELSRPHWSIAARRVSAQRGERVELEPAVTDDSAGAAVIDASGDVVALLCAGSRETGHRLALGADRLRSFVEANRKAAAPPRATGRWTASRLQVGQRFHFAYSGGRMVWTLESFDDRGARYTKELFVGEHPHGAPDPAEEWRPDQHWIPRDARRERFQVGDLELECAILEDGTWVVVDGDRPLFPGRVRDQHGKAITYELVKIEAPVARERRRPR